MPLNRQTWTVIPHETWKYGQKTMENPIKSNSLPDRGSHHQVIILSSSETPYNSREMIHCLEILFITTKFEYNFQLIQGPWSSGVSVPTLLSQWSTSYKIIRMIMSIKTIPLNSITREHYVNRSNQHWRHWIYMESMTFQQKNFKHSK